MEVFIMNTKATTSSSSDNTSIEFGVTASVDRVGSVGVTTYNVAMGAIATFQLLLSAWLERNQPTITVGRDKRSLTVSSLDVLRDNKGAMKSLFNDSWSDAYIDRLMADPKTMKIVKGESVSTTKLSVADIRGRVVRAMTTDSPILRKEDGVSEAYANYFSGKKAAKGTFFRDMENSLLKKFFSAKKNGGAGSPALNLLEGIKKDMLSKTVTSATKRLTTAKSKGEISQAIFDFCTKELESCFTKIEKKLSSK